MKKILCLLSVLLLSLNIHAEDNSIYDLVAGHDYYIFNTYYQRVLGTSADQSQPRLVKYASANDAQYLFTAEAAPTAGTFLLKHKSTGKYITASTSNSYSVNLTTTSGTGKNYQWRVRPGISGQLVNLRDADSALGVDAGETADYIGVWYDKAQDSETSRFQVFESNGKGMESSRLAWAKKELLHVSSYILDEVQNTGYPAFYRSRLTTSAEDATQWAESSDEMTPDTLLTKAQHLRDSLAIMTSYESTVLLTATEMESFGSTFSLGLSEFTIADKYPGDSVYVLVRNKVIPESSKIK